MDAKRWDGCRNEMTSASTRQGELVIVNGLCPAVEMGQTEKDMPNRFTIRTSLRTRLVYMCDVLIWE